MLTSFQYSVVKSINLFLKLTGLFGQMQQRAQEICVEKVYVTTSKMKKKIDVVFLTDIHYGPTVSASFLNDIISKTNELDPDIVLLGGDYLFKDPSNISFVAEKLSRIHSRKGIYAVFGNHDYWLNINEFKKEFRKNGIKDLTNTGYWIDNIKICGVGDLYCDEQNLNTLNDVTMQDFVILLSHNPDYYLKMNKKYKKKIDLMISGHTHGGQINLPLLGAITTQTKLGRRFRCGFFKMKDLSFYVSRGLGTVEIPVRINCPSELTLFSIGSETHR